MACTKSPPIGNWAPAAAIASWQPASPLLDSAGIDMQILSATPLSPHLEDEQAAVDAARRINDEYAELAARYPTRFRAIASLPLPHIDVALRELERAFTQLNMLGACITTSVLGLSIANPLFEPLYQELNRRHSVLAIHPAGRGAHSPLIADYALTWSIGAPIEDTVAAMHFILNGIPQRFPEMKIIVPHLGGLLPMTLERLDQTVAWEAPNTPEPPKPRRPAHVVRHGRPRSGARTASGGSDIRRTAVAVRHRFSVPTGRPVSNHGELHPASGFAGGRGERHFGSQCGSAVWAGYKLTRQGSVNPCSAHQVSCAALYDQFSPHHHLARLDLGVGNAADRQIQRLPGDLLQIV